jgi:hypothetical protein
MADYLTSTQEFCDRSVLNETEAAELEAKRPGWLARQRTIVSAYVDSRLAVRGDVPFMGAIPEAVKCAVADLITPRAFDALGYTPSDERQAGIGKREDAALLYLAEAADPVKGLVVLPKQQGLPELQPTSPTTNVYSEQSPFTSKHRQFDSVRSDRRYG